jgi:hypothetical protein
VSHLDLSRLECDSDLSQLLQFLYGDRFMLLFGEFLFVNPVPQAVPCIDNLAESELAPVHHVILMLRNLVKCPWSQTAWLEPSSIDVLSVRK